MMRRPLFVTVFASFLIVMSLFSVLVAAVSRNYPDVHEVMRQVPLVLGIHIAGGWGAAANIIAGIAMLRAKNWGRWLYVLCGLAGIGVNLAVSPEKPMLLYGVVLFVCMVYFLFRSRTHFYFQTSGGIGNA